MRVVLTKGLSGDSTAKGLKASLAAVLAIAALGMSAAAGAWMQSRYSQRQPAAASGSLRHDAAAEQTARDASFMRGNIQVLAAKVGDLQAKLIEMSALSRRLAEAAGISYTDPEIQAGLEQAAPVMDYIGDASQPPARPLFQGLFKAAPGPAEGLGRQLDKLQRQISLQKDWFAMMDLALTQRAGVEASLPSLAPVDYPYLSSSFGWRRHPISGRYVMHEGLDFAAPRGAPIHAASGGVVTVAGYQSGYGKMVEIHHGNGLVTRYAHASELKVKAGDLVEKGQLIAKVGSTGLSTGPHLHFEVRMAGHPLDPTLFLAKPRSEARLVADAAEHGQAAGPQVR